VSCKCREPHQGPDPRRAKSCLSCGKLIDLDAEWAVNDRTHNAFLDRVEEALAESEQWPDDEPPPEWLHFRYLALSREQAGRKHFGLSYLGRDNIAEGAAEASDGLNYTYFDTCQAIRHGDDVEWDLILTAAYHDFMAYRTRLRLRGRRHGSP
jgi:hypothetical protein